MLGTDSARRLFGRRYRSGDGFTVVAEMDGGRARLGLEDVVKMVEWGRGVTLDTLDVPGSVESSLDPDLWLKLDKSEDDDEDVVDIEAGAG